MPNTTDLGRAVFLSAESAVIDDFSRVTEEHLAAAIAYGEQQIILPARARVALRLLKAERAGRNQTTGR